MKLTTDNIVQWQDFIYSLYNIPIDSSGFSKKGEFFGEINICHAFDGVSLSSSRSSKRQVNSCHGPRLPEQVILAYTYSPLHIEDQSGNYAYHNASFLLDPSKPFNGIFLKDSHIKSCSIHKDLIPGVVLDRIRDNQLVCHPLYTAIHKLIGCVDPNEEKKVISHKLATIINLLSITDFFEYDSILDDVHFYIRKRIIKGERFSLDDLANDFFMSRRKMQYIFSSNNTTFINTVKSIKEDMSNWSLTK